MVYLDFYARIKINYSLILLNKSNSGYTNELVDSGYDGCKKKKNKIITVKL
jgi:hypothetical protein